MEFQEMTKPVIKIRKTPKAYKLNPEKLKGASQSILPYLFGSHLYYSEDYEYFDKIKYYLDIPEPRKSIEELQQELDEKIDALIKTTKEKFECSNYFAGKRYNEKFDRIIQDFEYAKEHGQFPLKYTIGTLSGSYLISNGTEVKWTQSFVIKQGKTHEGYYTFGNRKYFKYYMPDKPNVIVRFFMRTCLGFVWVDEKND
jgi:hypothetical protein